jgi:hypothetical protein
MGGSGLREKKGSKQQALTCNCNRKCTGPMVMIQDSGVDNNMLKLRHQLGVQHI